ncbi:MAG: polyprenyl synthetase family protein [Myxococcota bacterium]
MAQSSTASSGFVEAVQRIQSRLKLVERSMREQLTAATAPLPQLGAQVLGSGGKRLRPALLLWAAEICGYTGPRCIQVAAAIELLHTATLLHDDVVDCSALRRGRPSANAIWGNRRAVLAGDFFYARASSMIVEDGDQDILWVFANTIRCMAEGELLQLAGSFDIAVTEATYFSVIEYKSAALLASACEAGSILGGVTRAERRKLAEFGREMGLAFQLRDDALDYVAGEEQLGKPPHGDIREGKITLPLLLTLKRCAPAERELIGAALKSASRIVGADGEAPDLDLAPVLRLVERHRGVADTNRRAESHVTRAIAAIAAFPDGRVKRDLIAAAHFAAGRDH